MPRTPSPPPTERTSELVQLLITALGLPADTPDQAVIDRAAVVFSTPPGDEPPPISDAPPEAVLNWAQRTGRIAASSRPTWARNLAADPECAGATLRVLAPAAHLAAASAPRSGLGPGAAAAYPTASGLDISTLPPIMRAMAAREPDRGRVIRWQQEYGGLTDDEAAPAIYVAEPELGAAIAATQESLTVAAELREAARNT